jgi:pimeloyl-ACP methyl ester carboxylesterase
MRFAHESTTIQFRPERRRSAIWSSGAGPIVLVHGAWHGGWCWSRVAPLLATAAGSSVHAPSLTGLGDRAHLARPDIGLQTHAQDIVALLEAEDLRDVVLVGHGSAGFILAMLAERVKPRLRQLVFLDAFVPDHGSCVLDFIRPRQHRAEVLKSGWETGYAAPPPLQLLGVRTDADLAWARARLVAQPFASLEEPLLLNRPVGNGVPRSFIACVTPAGESISPSAERVRNDPGWDYQELVAGHDAMITQPDDLVHSMLGVMATQIR